MLPKVLIITIFIAITIGIGVYFRKRASSVSDFVLGGRTVGPWLTAFAYGTSYFSSVVFVGYAGQFGWSYGVSATWIGIGNAVIGSFLAWSVMGRRTRIMTKHFDTSTMPDFFSKRYNSAALKVVASVIIFVFLVPYSASVYKGLSGLFAMTFDLSFTVCIVGIAILTGIYVIAGGYMATAVNDFVQGIIMLVGIILVVAFVVSGSGGFISAMERLSAIPSPAAPNLNGAFSSFFGPDPLGLLGVVVLTSLGTWGLPQMVHKFYTIKNEKAIITGTVISTLFALIIAGGSYFMGSFGRLYYSESPVVFDEIVPKMLSSALPDVLIGIVLVLVLSASMSTLSSLVITSSSTFALDFLKVFSKKARTPKSEMVLIRVLCAVFILLSALIALSPNSLITTLMSLSWGTLAGAFLGPFLYGLFWRGATTASVWASFAAGIGITVANYFLKFAPAPTAGAIAIVASLLVVPLVSLVTPKLPKADVDRAFSCYDETVYVPQKVALEPDGKIK